MNVFFANSSPDNLDDCIQHDIFRIRAGYPLPTIDKGDIILLRITGKNSGVKAIWILPIGFRFLSSRGNQGRISGCNRYEESKRKNVPESQNRIRVFK